MVDSSTPLWLQKLASRHNFIESEIPYIPVPLQEIEAYVKSDDFETHCVHSIETIGILLPLDQKEASLVSTPGKRKSKLKLSIGHMNLEDLYANTSVETPARLKHAYQAVRIFGDLEIRDNKIELVVEFYDLVNQVDRAEKLLKLLAQVAHRQISMYSYDPTTCEHLENYEEDEMMLEKMEEHAIEMNRIDKQLEELPEEIKDDWIPEEYLDVPPPPEIQDISDDYLPFTESMDF